MNVPDRYRECWKAFVQVQGADPTPLFSGAFSFAGSEIVANELAKLVAVGRKRATAALLWAYEYEGERIPRIGDLSIVTDFKGAEVCVIETGRVEVVPFSQVTTEFAAMEGEGDGSLTYWRRTHETFFKRECERIGRIPNPEMPIVCECFKVVYSCQRVEYK